MPLQLLAVIQPQRPAYYTWLVVVGIAFSLLFWTRLARRDPRLLYIWLGALVGAFAGAKLAYVAGEGWRDFGEPDRWRRLAAGKSILGALLGGYATVELVKKCIGYNQPTGDAFAMVVPSGIALGRLGCWLSGCCLGRVCEAPAWWTVNDAQGIPRWPAVPVEFAFNVTSLALLWVLRRQGRFPGNLFHLYLIAYGLFRFGHETFRDTPRVLGPVSGYAIWSLLVAGLGAIRFWQRQKSTPEPKSSERESQGHRGHAA